MGDPVVQWQFITNQPARHSAFYASVFGWKINSDNPLGYRTADTASARGIAGGFWPAPPETPAFVQLFVEVTDLSEAVKKAISAGGSVLIPPQTLPDGVQMAILRDPFGVSVGLVVPASS